MAPRRSPKKNKGGRNKRHPGKSAWKSTPFEPFVFTADGYVPLRLHDPFEYERRKQARSLIGDGNDADELVSFRPAHHDPRPIATKGGMPIKRIVSFVVPNTTAGSASNTVTVGDLQTALGVSQNMRVESLEVQAVGARIATFQIFSDIGNEQLGCQVIDCAPPTAHPGVKVRFAQGSYPTFNAGQTTTTLLVTTASDAHKAFVTAVVNINL